MKAQLAITCGAAIVGLLAGVAAKMVAQRVLATRRLEPNPVTTSLQTPIALLTSVAFATIGARHGFSSQSAECCALLFILATVSLTDLQALLVPNGCIAAAMLVRLVYLMMLLVSQGPQTAQAELLRSLSGATVVGCFLILVVLAADRALGKESMGGGDLKLFTLGGLYFGWQESAPLVAVACVLGVVFSLWWGRASHATGGTTSRGAFPFAPAISVAFWLTMLAGDRAVASYLALLSGPLG